MCIKAEIRIITAKVKNRLGCCRSRLQSVESAAMVSK
jgi:hypothetical protein